MPKRPYPRWQRRHAAVLLWLVANPGGKLYECAAATGYSRSQISRIVNAPEFMRRYEAARDAALREAYFARLIGKGDTGKG